MNNLDDKILSGYWYTIETPKVSKGEREVKLHTGKAGIEEVIKAMRENGTPDELIEEIVYCYTDIGKFPLKALKIIKKDG